MNTTNRSRLTIALTATVAAVALVLTGCVPEPTPTPTDTTTPTPTPTATTDPQPESESEAIDAAELAIDDYLYIRGKVVADGGIDIEPLDEVASGTALRIAQEEAGRVAENEWRVQGQLSFDPTSSYATTLEGEGVSVPFASVSVTGCQDGSGYNIFNPDGTPAQQPTERRNVLEFRVIWEPTRELWLVSDVLATGETC
jgi:hypothetical protein